LLGAEEAVGKGGRVQQQEQDSLLAPDTEGPQPIAYSVRSLGHLGIGDGLVSTNDGRPASASFVDMSVDQVVGNVELVRHINDGSRRVALDRRCHTPSL